MTSDPAAKDGRGHTPAPWINDDTLILPSGFDDADDSRYQAWIADLRAASNAEANARRIVACVNACEGVPIAELEDLAALKCDLPNVAGVAQMAILNDDLEADRDRLRERMEELENALQKIANHDGVSEIIARIALSKSPK